MARKKRPVHFDIPRDDQGHFLPKELWTKKEVKEYDRLKREGLLANPMRKTKIKGTKKATDLYVHPRGKKKKFIPKEQWSDKEKRLAKKAQKEGLTIAAQLPRDDKGRFVSPTGKKSKKKKDQQLLATEYPAQQMVSQRPGDSVGMHQGNVTVVYPPYPPPPAATAPSSVIVQVPSAPEQPGRFHASRIRQLPSFAEESLIEEEIDIPIKLLERHDALQERHDALQESLRGMEDVQRQLMEACAPGLKEVELYERKGTVEKNPRSLYPRYYVEPTFGERVGNTLSNLAKSPLLALVAIGAIAAIGYALYRAIKAFQYRALASVGVDIVGGTIYFPGEQPYVITDEDRLWLARSIWGEVSRDPAAWTRADVKQGGSAVLWAYANHYMTVGAKRNLYPTLGEFVQAYSQPINPRWDSASDTRCLESPEMCTPDRLAFRNTLRTMPWTSFPPALQNLVISFAAGQVPNPVGTRTDFRAAGTGYTPGDPLNLEGNVFGTASNARRRPVEQVA